MIRKIITPTVFVALASTLCQGAQTSTYGHQGTLAAIFLMNNPSVRANGLGGSHASADGYAPDLFSNPASLIGTVVPELFASHTQSIESIKHDGLLFGTSNGHQALGGFIDYLDKGHASRSTIDNAGTITEAGELHYSTLLGGVTAAQTFRSHRVGMTAKAWQDSLDTKTQTGWAADIGYQSPRFRNGLNAGAVLQNIGPAINGHGLPRTTSLSTSFLLETVSAKLSGMQVFQTVLFPAEQDVDAITGFEYDHAYFALRFGYRWRNEAAHDATTNIAVGAALKIKGWNVDYAYRPLGILGDEHRFAVTIRFGMTAAERQQAAQALDKAMKKRITDRSAELRDAGLEAAQRGEWEKAVESLQAAVEWDPENNAAISDLKRAKGQLNFAIVKKYMESAEKFARDGAWLEAAHQCRQALKLMPNYADAQNLLKQSEQKIQQSQRANANEIIDDTGFSKGVQLFLQGKYDAALAQWSQLKSPDNKNQLVREFINKAKQAKLEQRIVKLETSIQEKKDEIARLEQRAYTFYSLGQIDMAIDTWRKILEIAPDNLDARRSLRDAESRQKLSHTPASSDALTQRVKSLDRQAFQSYSDGDVKAAVSLWKQALELDPKNISIQKNLRRAQNEMSDNEP